MQPTYPAVRRGTLRPLRVALFITCFNDTLFPDAGRATVAVLERLGCEVEFRAEQTCCVVGSGSPERLAMDALARVFRSGGGNERAQRMARAGKGPIARLGGWAPIISGWTAMRRDLPGVPEQSFRDWWRSRDGAAGGGGVDPADAAGRSHEAPS